MIRIGEYEYSMRIALDAWPTYDTVIDNFPEEGSREDEWQIWFASLLRLAAKAISYEAQRQVDYCGGTI